MKVAEDIVKISKLGNEWIVELRCEDPLSPEGEAVCGMFHSIDAASAESYRELACRIINSIIDKEDYH